MLENIRLAFQGVWSHKLRSMLTMLGIIIGIASIISIVSTIQGTNEQIKQNLIGGGNNTVDIELYRADEKIQVSDYEQAPSGVPTITNDILQEIKDVDGVESAAAYYSRSYADSIYYNNNSLQGAQVLGVDNNYFSTTGYVVRTGRTFREEDYKEFHKVVILDQSAATSLFQEESPLGKRSRSTKSRLRSSGLHRNWKNLSRRSIALKNIITIKETKVLAWSTFLPHAGAFRISMTSRRMLWYVHHPPRR